MSSTEDDVNKTPPKKKKKVVKRLQKFKEEWLKSYDWLGKADCEYHAKCKICKTCFTIAHSGIGQVKQHNDTAQHKKQLDVTKSNGILDKFIQRSEAPNFSGNDVTATELAYVYHTVKHNLSYNSMDCTIKLNKGIYTDSKIAKNMTLGRTKMSALVNNVLGPYALDQVLSDLLRPGTYFSVQTDASNRKNIKLFPLVVQYFDIENGVQNKLIDFYENADESANGMFETIKHSLTAKNLSLDKISGLSADNTNANFGVHNSLYRHLEKLVPHLIKGNCHAHRYYT